MKIRNHVKNKTNKTYGAINKNLTRKIKKLYIRKINYKKATKKKFEFDDKNNRVFESNNYDCFSKIKTRNLPTCFILSDDRKLDE